MAVRPGPPGPRRQPDVRLRPLGRHRRPDDRRAGAGPGRAPPRPRRGPAFRPRLGGQAARGVRAAAPARHRLPRAGRPAAAAAGDRPVADRLHRRKADILAGGEPVRDHWSVLARRDPDHDRIRSRRMWLRGARTGSYALVLSFAPAGQPLDDSLTVGTEAEADLVFYPGAVPLRAVALTRRDAAAGRRRRHGRGAAGVVGGRARRGPLAGQLARRRHGDPGPRPGTVPGRRRRRRPAAASGGGRLLAAVRALRRAPADGGRRVDPSRPVAADRLGHRRGGGTAVSKWQDLVTASLIGTERAVVPVVAVPGLPSPADAPADPAELLLDRAALMTAARRGGRRPGRAEALPAGEPDRRPW